MIHVNTSSKRKVGERKEWGVDARERERKEGWWDQKKNDCGTYRNCGTGLVGRSIKVDVTNIV